MEEVKTNTADNDQIKDNDENVTQEEENQGQTIEECLTIENERLITENDKLSKESQELTESLQRQKAEFDNYRRRTLKEKEELRKLATGNLLANLLPVLDNFDRALAVDKESGLMEGMKMVYAQLVNILTEAGLTTLGKVGEVFDPNFHDALMQEEQEGVEENTILEVLQKGYKMEERLLRPAMVKVAK